jgi:hypothetical protein
MRIKSVHRRRPPLIYRGGVMVSVTLAVMMTLLARPLRWCRPLSLKDVGTLSLTGS